MSLSQNSDSSDDDVCFGEYTLKEAKKDLQKYVPKKVNRRHTLSCKLSESQINTKEETPIMANPVEEKNISTSNSNTKGSFEYLTANETMSTDKSNQNSEFLEKLTKVINEPSSEASSYNTAFDRTGVLEITNNHCDDTFLERFKNQTTFALDNVHHTLVENTVITTEGSLNEVYNYDDQNDESCSSEEVINGSIITISDESLSQLQNSAYEFLTNEKLNVSTSPIMSNREITCDELLSEAMNDEVFSSNRIKSREIDHTNSLYEDSINPPIENHNYSSVHDKCKVNKSGFCFESLNIGDSDIKPKDYSCNTKLQNTCEYSSDMRNFSENISFKLNLPQPEPIQRFERVIVDYNQLSKISEKTEFTTCIADGSSIKPQEETKTASSLETLSGSEKCNYLEIQSKFIQEPKRSTTLADPDISSSSSSEVSKASSISGFSELGKNSVSEIHLKKFDDSCQFDDTLEEMNRLLAQGVDYEMPEIACAKGSPLKELLSSNDIISGSFMNTSKIAGLENRTPETKTLSSKSLEKCKKFYSAEKITKPSVKTKGSTTTGKYRYQQEPVRKPASAISLFTKYTDKLGVESAFKVPTKPTKKLPTPSKIPNPTLKNIVSPVGVYIKHSPKYFPMKRVPLNTKTPYNNIVITSVKENIPCASNQEIPKVIYKPAKNKEITEEKDIILPGSLKKFIKEQVVTKHEQRIQDNKCNQSIERQLMESECSINLSHGNEDISIMTNKQPFTIGKF